VRELEAKNAAGRKELMQTLFEHLNETGVKAELQLEPAVNFLGEEVKEPVVVLNGQNLAKIRLAGVNGGGCSVPGDILRFQYEVNTTRKLAPDEVKQINSFTRVIKEGKVLNYFGGKVVGIRWEGQKLAEDLNRDQAIADNLKRCVKVWSYLEFQIEAVAPSLICIQGPRFSDAGAIADLYHSENKDEIQCCAFGFDSMEKIAGHIKAIAA
jgi:hypothetical protein